MKNKNNKTLKRNNKGFTMVELLATIVILSILVVVSIAGVTKVLERAKKEYYQTTEKSLKLAAQNYVQTNRNRLPKKLGHTSKIKLSTLKGAKYIESLKDYNKKTCDPEKSYVQIFKYSKTDYSYLAYLECPNYKSTETINDIKPEIVIDFKKSGSNADSEVKKAGVTITIRGNSLENQAQTKQKVKLLGYNYIIYKDNKEVISSGSLDASYAPTITKTIDLAKYTPGEISVKVSATNIYGLSSTSKKTTNYKDVVPPICGTITGAGTNWVNKDRRITVKCSDGNGSGCTRPEFTKTFRKDITTGYITIEDEAGNKTNCRVNVYLDKTEPTCKVNASGTLGNNGWYKGNDVTLTLSRSDNLSGIAGSDLTTSKTPTYNGILKATQGDTTGITWYGYVKDKAGNTTSCSKSIKVDTKKPTCSITKSGTTGTNGWYKEKNVSLTLNRSDTGGSNIDSYDLTKSSGVTYNNNTTASQGSTSGVTWYGYIKDKAGNVNKCNTGSFKVDTTKPTCSFSGENTTWKKTNVAVKATCSDSYSKCTSGTASNTWNFTSGTYKTKSLSYTLIDNAGNSSTCSKNANIYFDKEPPTVPTTGSIGAVSGSNASASIKSAAGGSTDAGIGRITYKYLIKNDSATPANTDSRFTTSKNFTRSCGKSYFAWAIAEDGLNQRSSVRYLGSTSDGANSYSGYGSCIGSCGTGTHYRTNSCALVTTGLSESCNTGIDCCSWTEDYDCGTWSWSNCSKACGGGTKYQYRTCKTKSKYNGQTCSTSVTRYQSQGTSCNTQGCCTSTVDYACTGWAWSTCSKTCGGGTRYQYKTCKTKSAYDGSACSSGVKRYQSQNTACNTQACYKTMYICRYATPCGDPNPVAGNTQWHPNKSNSWGGTYRSGTAVNVVDAGDGWWKEVGQERYIKKGCLTDTRTCCAPSSCTG